MLEQSASSRQNPSGVVVGMVVVFFVVVGVGDGLGLVVVGFSLVIGSVVGSMVGLGVLVTQSTPLGQSQTGPSGN